MVSDSENVSDSYALSFVRGGAVTAHIHESLITVGKTRYPGQRSRRASLLPDVVQVHTEGDVRAPARTLAGVPLRIRVRVELDLCARGARKHRDYGVSTGVLMLPMYVIESRTIWQYFNVFKHKFNFVRFAWCFRASSAFGIQKLLHERLPP